MIIGVARKIISTVVLLVLGAVLWQFRDAWWPKVRRMLKKETGVDIRTQAVPSHHDVEPGVRWGHA